MSPFLHFTQISPVYLALQVRQARQGLWIDRAAYLEVEALIMRREPACNFVCHESYHDQFSCLPEWTRWPLAGYAGDRCEHLYDVLWSCSFTINCLTAFPYAK